MNKNISDPDKQRIEQEQQILATVVQSIEQQIKHHSNRFETEIERSRALTAELVGTRRDEEKWQLASDEAVAHGLTQHIKDELKILNKLRSKPYFARVVVEELRNEKPYQIEYKLGTAANPECRIIDWRKAPLAKLFYEYKEGDEYSEEIQGRERDGTIMLRNTLEVREQDLKRISFLGKSFYKDQDNNWNESGSSNNTYIPGSTKQLSSIVSLISPDQFKLITEEADSAVLIQGVAGSGKTTVALHRLAWLLHEDNSDLLPEQSIVLVRSKALKIFSLNVLPSLGIEEVKIYTWEEWSLACLKDLINLNQSPTVRRATLEEQLVLSNIALVKAIENYIPASEPASKLSPTDILAQILAKAESILAYDQTKSLRRSAIESCSKSLENQITTSDYDRQTLTALLFVTLKHFGGTPKADGFRAKLGHIVCDEVQDLTPLELACCLMAVDNPTQLTLVGDSSQITSQQSTFPGWDKLRQHWQEHQLPAKFVSLTISFRSTLPIMQYADHIQQRRLVTKGRTGRVPIWFRCKNESYAIKSLIDWLNIAQERYPTDLSCVICSNNNEAKQLTSLLSPKFGAQLRLCDENNFSFEEGICVADVDAVKGLEFRNVVIWNPSTRNYPNDVQYQNSLYVAATRAEENLCIISFHQTSHFLPGPKSSLVRYVPVGFEELDS